MVRWSPMLLLLLAGPALGQRGQFWDRVADPHRQHVEALVQRAQAELGDRPGGGLHEGAAHAEILALAYYGLAVALDRDEQPGAAREAMARALELDGKMSLLDAAREDDTGIFFVPAGDVHYYRAIALTVLGRPREAVEAFQRF